MPSNTSLPSVTVTILCGGVGSRLWPVSRDYHPKPFIRLNDGQSFLEKTFLRSASLPQVERILTVTNEDLGARVLEEFQRTAIDLPMSMLLEPARRNTAPALALACLEAQKHEGPEALMLVMPADHLIKDLPAFEKAYEKAVQLAQAGAIVTFGIKPYAPETGYGYIQAQGHEVTRFVEKPSLDKAKAYLQSGDFYWNAGMFCFQVGQMLKEMALYCPEILSLAKTCDEGAKAQTNPFAATAFPNALFQGFPDLSIDYAVIENSQNVAVVPCDIGWLDVGSWSSWGELVAKDEQGNQCEGHVLLQDAKDCLIHNPDRLVAALGVEHLLIVSTPDALLVADKSQSQRVKEIVDKLDHPTTEGKEPTQAAASASKPWGKRTLLKRQNPATLYLIELRPDHQVTLEAHPNPNTATHWHVLSGEGQASSNNNPSPVSLQPGSYLAPQSNPLTASNPSQETLVILEVQTSLFAPEESAS